MNSLPVASSIARWKLRSNSSAPGSDSRCARLSPSNASRARRFSSSVAREAADVGAVEEQAEFVKLVGARAQQHHVEQQRAQNLRPDGAAQVRPAPLRGLYDAQDLQHLHRLAYARLADAVALRELALRGQRLAGAELAVPYRLLYAFEYEL